MERLLVKYQGKLWIVEDQKPSILRAGHFVYRLRIVKKDGSPGKTVQRVVGGAIGKVREDQNARQQAAPVSPDTE